VGIQIGLKAHTLRQLCSKLVLQYQNTEFNGLTLKQWIEYETEMHVKAYARAIATHMWGGTIEIFLLSKYLHLEIVVYGDLQSGHARKLLQVRDAKTSKRPVCLLYCGSTHYDALLRQECDVMRSIPDWK
jgi:hypothetical protein